MRNKKTIAFIHRYGLEGWICCGGHAVPGIVDNLRTAVEVHFYGPKTTEEMDRDLRSKVRMHELPFTWDRANPRDKYTKTILWYLWLPIIGLRCRGVRLIWNDETVPLTAPILRLFYGGNIAITVMDFFARIYTENHPRLHWLRNLVEHIDFAAWRRLPLLFTKVHYTQEFLAEHGVPRAVMHLYRNPVDHTKFHPVDEATRKETRARLGFVENDIVLSHHGILHPNKGNDWILHRLSELKATLPRLKYLIIGNGPEMNNLKRLASTLGIADRVVFTGWLPSETELNNALASSDIGLVMRIGQETDHFHMTDTLAHELACGKPVLAVNLKGIAEVIEDGVNGYLFSPDETEGFQTKITRLCEEPNLRETFGRQALDVSREVCSVAACSDMLCAALRSNVKN